HRAITRQSGDRRLAAAGGARGDPGVLTVHHGGGVEQHTALLHEEKAAQQAEQLGGERGARTDAEAHTAPRDVAVGARRVAGKREVAVAPGREGPGWAPRSITLGRAALDGEPESAAREERRGTRFDPSTAGSAEPRHAEHHAGHLDAWRRLTQPMTLQTAMRPRR